MARTAQHAGAELIYIAYSACGAKVAPHRCRWGWGQTPAAAAEFGITISHNCAAVAEADCFAEFLKRFLLPDFPLSPHLAVARF